MKNILTFVHKHEKALPEEFRAEEDPRCIEAVARYFLKEFTKEGDKIFDPFAGFGTILLISEEMGRIPFGIEFDERRAEYIGTQIQHKENIIWGDSLELGSMNLPEFDFCFCSPPFTDRNDEDHAFTSYTTKGTYEQYLSDFNKIFQQLKQVMKKDSYIIIEVSNMKKEEGVTTLAWDVAREVSKSLYFEGEVIIDYKEDQDSDHDIFENSGYDFSYCLIFKNK